MPDFEKQIVEFYLKHSDDEDIDRRTCRKFGIDEQTLNYLLMVDLHESGM